MKLVTYDRGDAPRAGLALDGMIADLERAARSTSSLRLPASTRALLALEAKGQREAARVAKAAEATLKKVRAGKQRRPAWMLPEESVHLGPPVPDPEKVICIGLNYKDHCREQEGRLGRPVELPENPICFAKFASTLTGPYDPIRLPPRKVTAKVDYEVELAVVIGRTIRGVNQKQALESIAGYMVINDVSARDVQFADKQWVRAKSFDGFAPCGPWLVTPDEIANPQRLRIWSVVDGKTMQQGNTREMIFKLGKIVSFVSEAITLKPGDIIATGTPAGVGIFRDPPVLLEPGTTVECGIEGIGTICNTCERG